MNREDLIKEFRDNQRLTFIQAERIVDIFFESIIKALGQDRRIEIRGFGSFANRSSKGRKGYNPQNGERISIPFRKTPYFRPGKELKSIVNGNKPLN